MEQATVLRLQCLAFLASRPVTLSCSSPIPSRAPPIFLPECVVRFRHVAAGAVHARMKTEPSRSPSLLPPDELAKLKDECAPLHPRFGSRRSPRISRILFRVLAHSFTREDASALARAITGVDPDLGLKANEAHAVLRSLGVRKGGRFLYRIAEKAALAEGAQTLAIWMNAGGDWRPVGSPELRKPLAQVTVKLTASGPRFTVTAVKS